jgi:hypothetical protein
LPVNRGSFENLKVKSEVRSHDARMADNARPNGHIMSLGLRRLQHGCKRGLHIRQQKGNTILNRMSNGLRGEAAPNLDCGVMTPLCSTRHVASF